MLIAKKTRFYGKIKWDITKPDGRKKKILNSNKIIMIDFFTDWWYACGLLDANTFTDKNVISYLLKNKIKIIKKSSVYETEPLEYKKQRKFYNIVIEIEFSYSSTELFLILKNIENLMGRNFYNPRNYPRIIDIDILTYGN